MDSFCVGFLEIKKALKKSRLLACFIPLKIKHTICCLIMLNIM